MRYYLRCQLLLAAPECKVPALCLPPGSPGPGPHDGPGPEPAFGFSSGAQLKGVFNFATDLNIGKYFGLSIFLFFASSRSSYHLLLDWKSRAGGQLMVFWGRSDASVSACELAFWVTSTRPAQGNQGRGGWHPFATCTPAK